MTPSDSLRSEFPPSLEQQFSEALLLAPEARARRVEELVREHPQFAAVLRADLAAVEESERRVAARQEQQKTVATDEGSRTPDRFGPYKILGCLGEGGMGTVYLAEQKEPVRRRVALKVIKLGMDSKAVVHRFEAERQALAMMEHGNIARVYECGLTESGQPYFAMEYVKGVPMHRYCDENKVSVEDRLLLFRQVCSGVQHAHNKGVIHRDLTPNNVLVTLQDGKPTPKIIDFGLARATDHRLVEATIFTEQGQIVGTPEYMSPEQAGLGGLDIDARSDVYTLGVLLYELLVGGLPFPGHELRKAGLLEMQRRIREEDPPKPSTRLTSLVAVSTEIASRRRTDLRELRKWLRDDLDWVVMKALEKDRTRRYETVAQLSEDLQRYLEHEPVSAGPPSVGYRLKKFVRRYRIQCIAGAVVFLAIVGGGIGTYVQYRRAEAQAEIAREQTRKAQEQEELAKQRATELEKENEKNRIFADASLLAEALRVEEELYPAAPDKIQAMKDWLRDFGEPLEMRLPELRRSRRVLREKATSRPGEEPASRESHPRYPELRRRQSELDNENDEQQRAKLREQIATLENEIAVADYTFADQTDGYLHRTLTQLVTELEGFCREGEVGERGRLWGVRARLAEAETVRQRSIQAFRPQWDQAMAAIRGSDGVTASELYDHFAVTEQPGLVPLGMDSESKLWEFVHLGSGTKGKGIPVRDEQTGRLVPSADMGVVFVLLPGGLLPVEDGEQPDHRHTVRLDPFFLSKYELTQGQWLRLTGSNRSYHKDQDNLSLPVETVNWFDYEEVLRHQGWVLPSELQWEYGCRGGTTTPWWTGAEEESLRGKENYGRGSSLPVGSMAPNPFGLFDMAGNLWEWCLDEWSEYGSERAGDGLRPNQGSAHRVLRGGIFDYDAGLARSGFRFRGERAARFYGLGVRPARPSRL